MLFIFFKCIFCFKDDTKYNIIGKYGESVINLSLELYTVRLTELKNFEILKDNNVNINNEFYLEKSGNNTYKIRSENGDYVVRKDKKSPSVIGASNAIKSLSDWKFEMNKDETYQIRNGDFCLTQQGYDSNKKGFYVHVKKCTGDKNQIFKVDEVLSAINPEETNQATENISTENEKKVEETEDDKYKFSRVESIPDNDISHSYHSKKYKVKEQEILGKARKCPLDDI